MTSENEKTIKRCVFCKSFYLTEFYHAGDTTIGVNHCKKEHHISCNPNKTTPYSGDCSDYQPVWYIQFLNYVKQGLS